jgi:hypothetical protein
LARARPSRAAAKEAQESSSHLVRSERWNGLRAGDPVEVADFAGRRVTWEFRAHVLNQRNGSESIEVVGGGAGERTVRSFLPERIFAPAGRGSGRLGPTATRPSLADAPQLPFG